MEPRPLGRGMIDDGRRRPARPLASMEPRPLGRGMCHGVSVIGAARCASMEPRPLGRGMSPRFPPAPRPGARFNGATTSRSWNVVPVGAYFTLVSLLQWSHDLSVVEW